MSTQVCERQYDLSMTKRITVSLPDDVAEYLAHHPNSSAVVTDAVVVVDKGVGAVPERGARIATCGDEQDEQQRRGRAKHSGSPCGQG